MIMPAAGIQHGFRESGFKNPLFLPRQRARRQEAILSTSSSI
jgi:hypothetical protein